MMALMATVGEHRSVALNCGAALGRRMSKGCTS